MNPSKFKAAVCIVLIIALVTLLFSSVLVLPMFLLKLKGIDDDNEKYPGLELDAKRIELRNSLVSSRNIAIGFVVSSFVIALISGITFYHITKKR